MLRFSRVFFAVLFSLMLVFCGCNAALADGPVITVQPENMTGAKGDTVTTYVQATGDSLSYQWYYMNTTDVAFKKSSVKQAVYETTISKQSIGRQVYCVITDAAGNAVRTNVVSISELKASILDVTELLSFDSCYLLMENYIIAKHQFNVYHFTSIDQADIVRFLKQYINDSTFTVEKVVENDITYIWLTQVYGGKIAIFIPQITGASVLMLENGLTVTGYNFPNHVTKAETNTKVETNEQTGNTTLPDILDIFPEFCDYCAMGECNYCFGEGEQYCTGGCIGGRCIACDDGQVLVRFDINGDPVYRKCSYCNYGLCKKCGGDGYIRCSACYGSGDCSFCGGDGYK